MTPYEAGWPRAHNWFVGPISVFRNPDAGTGLMVNGWRLWGPGPCAEKTWDRNTNDNWCVRPYGHDGDHELAVGGVVLAPGESMTIEIPL